MLDDDIVVQNVDDDNDVEEDDLLCDLFTINEYQSITIVVMVWRRALLLLSWSLARLVRQIKV